MQNEITEADPGPRLLAQTEITERLQNFSLLASFTMTAADAKQILDWLDSQEFTETCRLAGADPVKVTGKFHSLIDEGSRENVRNALN